MTNAEYFDKSVPKSYDDSAPYRPLAIPQVPKKRNCGSNLCLMVLVIGLLFLVLFTMIISKGTNLNKFIYGSDKFGNTCGSKNVKLKGLNCSGKDMTDKPISLLQNKKINPACPFSKIDILPDQCVQSCNLPNQLIFHRCYPPNEGTLTKNSKYTKQVMEILNIIDQNLYIIALLSLAGIVLSYVMFLCLRCNVALTFWILTSFQLVIFMLATVYLWRQYITSEDAMMIYLFSAVTTTSYVVFLLFFIVCLNGSYGLIFELYAETMRAIFRVPMLLIQPLLTTTLLILTIMTMAFLLFLINSNKFLQSTAEDSATYQHVSHLPTTGYSCFVIFMMFWTYSFIDGCQTMVISGAVSSYYFTRNKSALLSPFYNSVLKTFHLLGIVAAGSLIVTLMIFMRSFAEYVVNKAYIQAALHGKPFWSSLIRGAKLLCSNLGNSIKITGFNYIVINGFSFQAMLLTMLMGIWMNSVCHNSFYTWIGLIFGALCACLVTLFMMTLINITSETIFFCFCEDQISNDGNNRPYYMNECLKQLLEKSKEEARAYRLS